MAKDQRLSDQTIIDIARKSMTPEQQEEYKRIGEHMYNTDVYRTAEVGSKVKEAKTEDLILYATEALKAGCDPKDLSDEELRALISIYGEKWYTRFDLDASEIRCPTVQVMNLEDAKKQLEGMSRQQRRALDRQLRKQLKKQSK